MFIDDQNGHQQSAFETALLFARTEGLVQASESSRAFDITIREAIKAREEGEEKVIVFNLSGHGLLDMQAYDDYLQKKIA